MIARRSFITGLIGLVAAPAIIQASSLMPISSRFIPPRGSLLTLNEITRNAVKLFSNTNQFLGNIDQQFADEFERYSAEMGKVLRIRLPERFEIMAANILNSDYIALDYVPAIDSKLALAAAVPLIAAKALEAPVTRRFWAA
jgi:hypothetical protein